MWKSTFSEPPEKYTQDKERHKSTFFSLFNKKKKSNKSGYSASENSIHFSKSHEKSKDKKKKNGDSNKDASDSEVTKNEVEHTNIPNNNYLKNYDSKNKKRESFFQKINILRKLRNYKIKKSATTFYMDHEESSSLGLDYEHMGKNEYVKKKKNSIKSEFINLKNKAQSLKNSIYFNSSKNSIENDYYNRNNQEYMGKKVYNILNLSKDNSKQFNNPYSSSDKANSLIANANIINKKDKHEEQDFSNISNISYLSEKKNNNDNNNISHNSSNNSNLERHKNTRFFEQKFDVDMWKENNNLVNDKNQVTHFSDHSFNIKRENEAIPENYYKDKEKENYGNNNNLQSNQKDSTIRSNPQNGKINKVISNNGYNAMHNKEKSNNNNVRDADINEYMKNEKGKRIINKDNENKICNAIKENEIEKKGQNIKAETNYTNNLSKVNNIYTSEFIQNRTDNTINSDDMQKEMILKLMYNNKGIYFNKDKYIDNSNNRENNIYKNYTVNNENIKYIPRNRSNINFKNKDILNITKNNKNDNNKNNGFSKEYKHDIINDDDDQNNIINKYIISPLYNLFSQTKDEAEKKLSTSYNKISSLPYHQIFQKYTSEIQKTYKTMYDIYENPKMYSMEYSKKSISNTRNGANNNNHTNENKNSNGYMDWNNKFYRNTYAHAKPSAYKNIGMISESNAINSHEGFKKNEMKIHKIYNNDEHKSSILSRKTVEPVIKIYDTNGLNKLGTNHLRNNNEIINNPSVCSYNNANHILQKKLFNINELHSNMGMINNKREDLKYEQNKNINFLTKGNNFYENNLRNNNNYNTINANIVTNIYLPDSSKKNNSISNSCDLFNNKNEMSNNSNKYYACKNVSYNNALNKSNTLHGYHLCNTKMNTNSYKNMNIHNNENYYNHDMWAIRCKDNSKQKYAPLNMNKIDLSKSIGYYPILQKSKTNINSSINNTNIINNLSTSLNEYNRHVIYPNGNIYNNNIAIHSKYTNCFEPINNEDIYRKNYLQKKSQSLNHRLLDCYGFKNDKTCDNNFFINKKNNDLKNVLGIPNLSKTNSAIEKNIRLPTENMNIRKIHYTNLQSEPIHHNTRNANLCNSYDHHLASSHNNYLSAGYIKNIQNTCNNSMLNGNLFVSGNNRPTNSYTNNMLINGCNNLQNKTHKYIRAKSLNALRDPILHSKSLKVCEDCCIKNKNENIINHGYDMRDIYKRCSYIGNEKCEIRNGINNNNANPALIKSVVDETNEKTNNIFLNDINTQIVHKKNDDNENDSDNCTSVTIKHYIVNNADNNKVDNHVLNSYNICEQEESLWMPNQYKIEKAILKESPENYIHKEEFQNEFIKCQNNFIDNGITQCDEDMLLEVIEKKENTNCNINDDEKKKSNDKVDQNNKEMIDICISSSLENGYKNNNSKYRIEKESNYLKDVTHDDFENTTMTNITIANGNTISSNTFENNASTCEMISNYNLLREYRNIEINNDAKEEKEKYDHKKNITKSTNNSSKIEKNNKLCKLKKASITKKNWKNKEIEEMSENEIYRLPIYLAANMCNTVFSEIDENDYESNFIKNKNIINKQKKFINFNYNYLGDTINLENDSVINSSDSTPSLKKNHENEKSKRNGNKEANTRKKYTSISTMKGVNISKGSFSNKNIKKELSSLGKSKISSKKLVKRVTKKGTVLNKNVMATNRKGDKNKVSMGEEKCNDDKKLKKKKIMLAKNEKVKTEGATKKKKIIIKKKKYTHIINKSEDPYLIGESNHSITYNIDENETNINSDIELDDYNINNEIEINDDSISDTIDEKNISNKEKINISINSEDEHFINKLELCNVPEVDNFYKMFKTMNNMLRNINNSNFLNNIDLDDLINIEKDFINNNIYINKYLITTNIENDQLKDEKNKNDSIMYDNNFSIVYLDNDMIYLKKKKLKNILDILLQNRYSFYEIKITILLLKLFISIDNSNIHTSIYPLTLINSLIHKLNLKVYDQNESIEDIQNHIFNKIENFNAYKNSLEQSTFNYLFICDGENYLCINDNSLCGETYQTRVNINNELGYYHYINLNRLTYYVQGKN
ncbi:conserved Plasmodium protein, unknown function [Plasmodium chabaudi chabaudi]|uniref:Uncharacterized protein n=1 Tax=Plasmodium chabaudi chabaudi TaxID=31271 RepID=A0A4V0K786_PLACU|nr:conserved Plasmodium protein, unknown function [Plasmodium chabaudi chabaudi]VTZ68929.1 conserved Plasmodium protein, unknown function [Plasmodium chabaudi chabaudi]|eukprot:XP_744471.2 conserved Plasmodium protein, unknown function [Plasmodium chabaudi chabaudi]